LGVATKMIISKNSSGTYSIGLLDKTTNNESWYRNSRTIACVATKCRVSSYCGKAVGYD